MIHISFTSSPTLLWSWRLCDSDGEKKKKKKKGEEEKKRRKRRGGKEKIEKVQGILEKPPIFETKETRHEE